MRRAISGRVRFTVLKRDDFKCQYCGRHGADVELHIDHINPVCLGGSNEMCNLVTACRTCNLGKGGVPLTEDQLSRMQFLAELRLERLESDDIDEDFDYTDLVYEGPEPPEYSGYDEEGRDYWIRHAENRREGDQIHLWHRRMSNDDLPPGYYFKAGPWVVTDLGLENLERFYPIAADDLGDNWERNLASKTWFNGNGFHEALRAARAFHGSVAFQEMWAG